MVATLASHFSENIRIIESDDYDSNEDYTNPEILQNIPIKYVVELKEATEDQIDNVIKSTVNITATTSIYDFHGELTFKNEPIDVYSSEEFHFKT